jgi:hypothetical protein
MNPNLCFFPFFIATVHTETNIALVLLVMSSSPLSPSFLEREIRAIFSSSSFLLENETQKSIRKQVMKRLHLDEFPSDQKDLFKQLVTRIVQEQEEEEEEEETNDKESLQDSEDENEDPAPSSKPKKLQKQQKTKKTIVQEQEEEETSDKESLQDSEDENEDPAPSSKPKKLQKQQKTNKTKKKKKTSTSVTTTTKKTAAPKNASSSYSSGVQRLLSLGQAMRLGPRLHHGLKDMTSEEERLEALTERLQEAGASWKGDLPTPQDIAKAMAEKKRKDDLDGLDTSLIVEGGRRRRGTVNYAVDVTNEDDDEEELQDQEEKKRPRKKAKSPKQEATTPRSSSSDEDSDDDGDFVSDESESEAEFED